MARVIVIAGPTATGKTALGVAAAGRFGGEVVSADSMQIYRRMDIGTAKPTPEETRGVPHHMIDCVDPSEDYSVSLYVQQASRCVDEILRRGRVPIIVGGTGLYIEALLMGTEFALPSSPELRTELTARYEALGGERMLRDMAEFDPEAAQKLAPADRKRIVRAYEIYRLTGQSKSEHDARTRARKPRYEAARAVLSYRDRAELYTRIDARVDEMIRRGLVDEVQTLLDSGIRADATAMQAIGYKEIASALTGGAELTGAIETVKRESRRYAKRQTSWFARWQDACRIQWDKSPDIDAGLQLLTNFLLTAGYNLPET